MNPLTMLDDFLADYVSPKWRRRIHSLILLAVALVALWRAADGDWEQFGIALAGALYAAANKANTTVAPLTPAGVDHESDDGESYEDSGGRPFPEDEQSQ